MQSLNLIQDGILWNSLISTNKNLVYAITIFLLAGFAFGAGYR